MASARRPYVLLVEDDEDNRELMAEVLADAGYEVGCAADGPPGCASSRSATSTWS